MTFDFKPLVPCELPQFRQDMQEAFQLGAEAFFGPGAGPVLPASHIDAALAAPGARAWKAAVDGAMAGGAVVSASGDSGSLDFLYVRHGIQSRGIGRRIWTAIEQAYPEVRVWETCTPWFDKRNIHFYINVCGFAAVEFFCAKHPDPHMPDVSGGSGEDCMFRFVKRLGMR
ncbi:MAG: GNAT family N-acetyltransferase [Desulfovibrio sp.]|nr:GNAT family N-acetyltransferase [Desulfovibrio sp.]